jgi:hypothetical protein
MSISGQDKAAWLLLTFTLPNKRASKRVEVWRKLQRYGTIPLGNSGYLLPNSSTNEERFEWLATAVRRYQGEASVVHVQSIDNMSTPQLMRRFREARGKDYQELIRELDQLLARPHQERGANQLKRLHGRFQEITEVDFFESPLQERVARLLASAHKTQTAKAVVQAAKINPQDFKNKLWVTRPRPGVDRCASGWFIRRFIDPKARFGFAREGEVPTGGVPFDMFHTGGFGHRGEDCTFETLQKTFRIRDDKVRVIGQIIHDADLLDEKFGRKEGFGIDEVLSGWAKQGILDNELIERGIQLIEGLYHSVS